MSKNKITYLFARLNLIAAYDDKFKFLYDSIKSNIIVDSKMKKYKYGIFQYNDVEIDSEKFIIGKLIKFSPSEDAEVVNLKKGTIDRDLNENQVVAKSNFVLHPKSGFIAFNPVGKDISENAFREKFSEIIFEANVLIDVDIQIISEEFSIFRALEEFDIINNVKITLHPSNPNMRDIWKNIDADLHASNVDSYNANYKSKKGLQIKQESNIYSKIAMASDGYGKALIEGEKKNKKKVASTDKLPVKCEVDKDESDSVNKTLLNKFKELWERMKS